METITINNFFKTGSCPKCGAAIWSKSNEININFPPNSFYSCSCSNPLAQIPILNKIDLEKLLKEFEELKKLLAEKEKAALEPSKKQPKEKYNKIILKG